MTDPRLVARVAALFAGITPRLGWVGPLLARITLGVVFIGSGLGKLSDLDKVTAFFVDLHLPAPHFQAVLVACTELVGGSMVLLGLGTRLAAVPLGFTMVIAILTAKRAEIDGLGAFFGFDEVAYLVMFLWLATAGGGAASLDRLLLKILRIQVPTSAPVSTASATTIAHETA